MSTKNKHELVISSHRGRWRSRAGGEPADKEFQKIKPTILAKDGHKCVYCGLRMEGKDSSGVSVMEVHHADCNHENNDPKNLLTTDHFCHAHNHIGFLGKMAVMGVIPEISMTDMNHLLRTIGVAMLTGDDEMKADARELYEILRSSSEEFATVWGTKNPADIGNALLAIPNEAYRARDTTLEGARIIFDLDSPTNKLFIERVALKAHGLIKPNSWQDIADEFLSENMSEWAEVGRQIAEGAEREREKREMGRD